VLAVRGAQVARPWRLLARQRAATEAGRGADDGGTAARRSNIFGSFFSGFVCSVAKVVL
jgi:hypothetical protein